MEGWSRHARGLRALAAAATVTVAAMAGQGAAGQTVEKQQVDPKAYVTREEYERVLRDQADLRRELEEMKRERAADKAAAANAGKTAAPAPTTGGSTSAPGGTGTGFTPEQKAQADSHVDQAIHDLRRDVDALQRIRPGYDTVFIAGDADVDFAATKHTPSSFSAAIAPLILWRPVDKLLIESAFDIGISSDSPSSSSTSFDLTIMDVSYELNDYMMIGGGLFVVPFGQYHQHFDPSWIDKLPDSPLPFGDGGIAPESQVGVFVKGALPAGKAKITYDAYLTNGPQLITDQSDSAGQLNFADYTDFNGNKAAGGRIALLPIPEMELGYSLQVSEPNPNGFNRVHAVLQALDFNYKPDIPAIGGILDFRGEYVWSDVSKVTYDPTGSAGFGPTRFGNYREGAYAQVAYRPTHAPSAVLKKLEFVGRFDFLNTPLNAPGGDHERRWTVGVDYWVAPNAVLKLAYEWDRKKSGDDASGFLAQFGIGF